MRRVTSLLLVFLLLLVPGIFVAGTPVESASSPMERVVFFEPATGFGAQVQVLAERDLEVVKSIPAFNAHLVRGPAKSVEALANAPGVRRVVPNVEFSVLDRELTATRSAPGGLFTVAGTASIRLTRGNDLGSIAPGGEVQSTVRVTNTGFAEVSLAVRVSGMAKPEGAELTTAAPEANQFRLQWYDPVAGSLRAIDEAGVGLSGSLLIAAQVSTYLRVTVGSPAPAGSYTVTQTVTATVVGAGAIAPATVADVPWHVSQVRADTVWGQTKGADIKVAVLDTGIDNTNLELVVQGGYNFVASNENWLDDYGHGTTVAGILAADGSQSGALFSGAAPKVALYAVKVLDSNGVGTLADILAGLGWAKDNGMQVVNMSFGTSDAGVKEPLDDVFASMTGIILVAAAGNNPTPVTYPAACDAVIAVGATDADYGLASWSARGEAMAAKGLLAPGSQVFGLRPYPYVYVGSGTSFSAPLVSAAAALLLAGGRAPAVVFSRLSAGATDLGLAANEQGAGFLNIEAAWNAGP
ncbi:MAG: S8 family serine peptidase [Chloroflexota bacterium]|nr:S8 family serine peptidase [Chloroflexota bacterium]